MGNCLAFDVGTYNLVTGKRNKDNNFVFKHEVNAFIELPIENRFIFNMMKNAGVPLIERPEAKIAYALGQSAVDISYTMNNLELKRPMKSGCLNPKERNAQLIMSTCIHSMIGELEEDQTKLFYCIPADTIYGVETDAKFHGKILQAIFNAFKDSKGRIVSATAINEALALVYAELQSKNFTGCGCSFGGGLINVCCATFGNPIFTFSINNSGDWIDERAARAAGESSTFINQEKRKLDLTIEPPTLVLKTIRAQYEIMMENTVSELKKGFEKNKAKNPSGEPLDFVLAGGSASPKGFEVLFEKLLRAANMPIEIGKVIKPVEPLFSVCKGCLIAAENS